MNITDVGHMTSDADEGEDKMILTAKKRKENNRRNCCILYRSIFS